MSVTFAMSCVLLGGAIELNSLSLEHVIPSQGFQRYAVASLGNELFVANYNSQDVEVFNTRNFKLERHLNIHGLGSLCYGLATCIYNSCLYASDFHNDIIHRVDLSSSSAVKKWSVASGPAGLSVNKARNVVVTCGKGKKLQEYTTDGSLVREISLHLSDPRHAIQLSTGDYMVSYYTSQGVVSVVGVNGNVVRSYGCSQTSNVRQMDHPRGLAVTKNNVILVADSKNHRVLLTDSSLNSVQVLALPIDGRLKQPWTLFLDESQGRLYVSENNGGRVFVFKNKV